MLSLMEPKGRHHRRAIVAVSPITGRRNTPVDRPRKRARYSIFQFGGRLAWPRPPRSLHRSYHSPHSQPKGRWIKSSPHATATIVFLAFAGPADATAYYIERSLATRSSNGGWVERSDFARFSKGLMGFTIYRCCVARLATSKTSRSRAIFSSAEASPSG